MRGEGTTTWTIAAPTSRRLRAYEGSVAENPEFELFYGGNIAPLARALTATLGDPGIAQDAAQHAMSKAFEQWQKIGEFDNPTGWCYRVGMNWATTRWRKRRREVMDFTDVMPSLKTDEPSSLDDSLVKALLKLPIDQREVVVLRLVQDWSIAETAEALGIAEGTVQSRYSRALARLRKELEHAYD